MDNLMIYLLKVTAGTAVFYSCYLLLFRKDKFFRRNRVFLILTLLLPAIIPFLKIPGFTGDLAPAGAIRVLGSNIIPDTMNLTSVSANNSSFSFRSFFALVYFTVSGVIILRMIISLISTYRIIRKGKLINQQFPLVVISDKNLPPFSFFPYAVLPEKCYSDGSYSDILDHEAAHLKGGHTFDLLLSELFIAFEWFNPFVWLIKKSIILNHEYLADHVSLRKNKSSQDYQYRLLNFQTGLNLTPLAHSFNNLIKNRIVMINKKRTPGIANLKNILILPVVAFVLFAFTRPDLKSSDSFNDSNGIHQSLTAGSNAVTGIVQNNGKALNGATIVVKGTTIGTLTDSKGHFSLKNLPDDAVLVVSYVGFKSVVEKADFKSEMNISMVRSAVSTEKVSVNPPSQSSGADEGTLVLIEEMPMYPGGESAMLNWISSSIVYPKEALKNNIKGVVYVNFVVGSNGKVKNVQVQKPVHPLLDAEATRVISKMPDWKPASQNGITVDVDYVVPVEFK